MEIVALLKKVVFIMVEHHSPINNPGIELCTVYIQTALVCKNRVCSKLWEHMHILSKRPKHFFSNLTHNSSNGFTVSQYPEAIGFGKMNNRNYVVPK